MGTSVYLGILEDGSEVAVKRMLKDQCGDAAENETKILRLINTKKSPFIVNYRHFLKDNTFMYLIVDLCEQTLDEYVCSEICPNIPQIKGRRMIKEILTGLEFLHGERILHRDLKPLNILVDVDGHMRLADFGISRILNENETTCLTYAKGTKDWMAAEVIENINKVGKNGKERKNDEEGKGRFKRKSDIQPAGMIAFFILTEGEHPFGSTVDCMTNILKGNPVNLNNLGDPDARQFVSRLICHKIHDRPYAHEALLLPFLGSID